MHTKYHATNPDFFYVFHIDFQQLVFMFNLSKLFHNESCREKLAPTSPNGSNIVDAAVNSVHRSSL